MSACPIYAHRGVHLASASACTSGQPGQKGEACGAAMSSCKRLLDRCHQSGEINSLHNSEAAMHGAVDINARQKDTNSGGFERMCFGQQLVLNMERIQWLFDAES